MKAPSPIVDFVHFADMNRELRLASPVDRTCETAQLAERKVAAAWTSTQEFGTF
jgi:hypothetical protein